MRARAGASDAAVLLRRQPVSRPCAERRPGPCAGGSKLGRGEVVWAAGVGRGKERWAGVLGGPSWVGFLGFFLFSNSFPLFFFLF